MDLKELWIGNAEIKVEIADTPEKRAVGLGGRKSLPKDQGMFFVFEEQDTYPFWMKDMRFGLDIIWIDENYEIVDLIQNVKPYSYPNHIVPDKKALYVLEVNSDWINNNKINIGDKIAPVWKYDDKLKDKENLIKITSPRPGDAISNRLAIEGSARGNWFFEASFPARLTDENGKTIAQFSVKIDDEWMTADFVSFKKEILLPETAAAKHGFLILEKSNPSGLLENEDKLEIPIIFSESYLNKL